MMNEEIKSNDKSFFQKMQEEVKILANINFILEKLKKERYFEEIQSVFHKILNNEIIFAIKGIFKKN